jgi:hypothetical protein
MQPERASIQAGSTGSASRRPFSSVRLAAGGTIIRGSKSMRNDPMRNDQVEMVSRLVREQEAVEARRETEARATAHGLIQGYIGPDHKVVDMPNFYSALVQAIRTARWQGQTDGPGEDILTLT